MGVALSDIVIKQTLPVKSLAGRKVAIDAYNTLYQFLATIRQPDGTPLMDSKGRVTSHLTGLIYRTSKLIEFNVLPAFVFDGVAPEQKERTIAERKTLRSAAEKKWKEAREKGEMEEARKYAQASLKLTPDMVEDAKKVLDAMGIPHMQAPAEGEAQAAYVTQRGDVWASASQDYDSLLFASPKLIRNMTITGKRKLPGKSVYVNVEPELITLSQILEENNITQEQLVEIGIMVGTDYNEGIKGVGPKTALKLIKEGKSIDEIYKQYEVEPEFDLQELKDIFLKPDITEKYTIEWKEPSPEKMLEILVEEHDFSRERVEKVIEKLTSSEENKKQSQSSLDAWTK
jgi:flap endonuclease-1